MWRKILWWWHRDKEQQDLVDELRAHVAIEAQQRSESGESDREAELAARRAFGNMTRVAEETRDVWCVLWLEQLWKDTHHALRSLRRTPAITFAVVATLALGIGANTALFSVIYTVLLKPLPYKDPDRLVWIAESVQNTGQSQMMLIADLHDWQNEQSTFEALGSVYAGNDTFSLNGESERLRGTWSSEAMSRLFGVSPALGRDFLPEDLVPGAARVALLTDRTFANRFGRDPAAIGSVINVGNEPHTVIGVLTPGFRLPLPVSSVVPQAEPEAIYNATLDPAEIYAGPVIGRLKPGVSIEAARADLARILEGSKQRNPAPGRVASREVRIEPLHEHIVGGSRFTLLVLWAAVGLVLLVACVNVTNLLLVRSSARAREISVRAALGAGRMRLMRQQLTESLVLALIGGSAGAALASLALRLTAAAAPTGIPRLRDATVDATALGFTFAVCALTGMLSGLVPAFTGSGRRPIEALKQASRAVGMGRRQSWLQGVLVVCEFSLALILLAGAALMLKSLWIIGAGQAAQSPEHVFTARIEMRNPQLTTPARRRLFLDETVERLEALPGVRAAAFALDQQTSMELRGTPRTTGDTPVTYSFVVTPDYFAAMGMRLLAGRTFDERDNVGAPTVVLVNEAFLRPYELADPAAALGRAVGSARRRDAPGLTIIGVVSDYRHRPDEDVPEQMFTSLAQGPVTTSATLYVRATGDPMDLAGVIRRVVMREPQVNLVGGETLARQMSAIVAPRRFQGALLSAFAAIAVLLALVGTYGVLNYSVAQRTQEIGVRMALGADRRDLLRTVLGRGLRLAAAGIILGISGAFALTKGIASLLYGVQPTDPWTYLAVCCVMLAVALVASGLPAYRATRVDPIEALRYE